MSVEAAFRSTHPDVLAAWREADTANKHFRAAMIALQERFNRDVMISTAFGGKTFAGFKPTAEDRARPPEGLRIDSHSGLLKADKRTKTGKQLHRDFNEVRLHQVRLPGMPAERFTGDHAYWPGFFEHEGTVWAQWGCGADGLIEPRDNGYRPREAPVDLDLWEHVRLSEYHAVREVMRGEAS